MWGSNLKGKKSRSDVGDVIKRTYLTEEPMDLHLKPYVPQLDIYSQQVSKWR